MDRKTKKRVAGFYPLFFCMTSVVSFVYFFLKRLPATIDHRVYETQKGLIKKSPVTAHI